MLTPETITWPDGSTLLLVRSGDRVTAQFTDPNGPGSRSGAPLPIPEGFAPIGSAAVILMDAVTGAALQVYGRDVPDGGTSSYYSTGVPISGAYLGEPVTGQRSLLDRLSEYVAPGAKRASVDADFLTECLTEAFDMVERHIGTTPAVPEPVRSRATLEAASELFHRRQAPSGISQYADATGAPVRLARDPMTGAAAILAPYLPIGFA